ncbi:MAG: hypothetical protein JXR58_03975 [Bacteroidales bacterium]|nr:hypothetical protein [Bacteroidales bacterium]
MKIAIFFSFSFLLLAVQSQVDYRVIKVAGQITVQRTGENLTSGSVFSDNENLRFGSSNSRAAVINPEKGRFVIEPANKNNFAASKSNFIPGLSNISSRSGGTFMKNVFEIKNFFKDSVLMFDTTFVVMRLYDYPVNDSSFFFITYINNLEPINKKLVNKGDTIFFIPEQIAKIDGNPIEINSIKEMQLFYYQLNKPISFVSSFAPVFVDEQIKTEIGIILDELKDKSYLEKFEAVEAYLTEFYTAPDEENLRAVLKNYFGLRN